MSAFSIGKKIRGITRNMKTYLNKQLADYSISEGQFEYFIIIYENEGINQKDLANIMNVGKASVTKAVKKLLEEDLVYRMVIEKDQRNYGLYISEKGKSYINFFDLTSISVSNKMFVDFSEEDIQKLQQLLDKLYNNSLKL